MRFHKIEMVGKFILQKVDSLPTFNSERDQGRLVYNLADDKVYQGSNIDWQLVDNGQIPEQNINIESPNEGKIAYYDGDLYYGDGSQWKIVGADAQIPVGDITTDTPTEGSLIYDDGDLYYGDGLQWNLIGGGGTATGVPVGDITTDTPTVGSLIYDDGNLYYGDGSVWNLVITETTVDTNLSSYTNQYTETSSWIVNHNLDGYANLVQCFNTSHQAITPSSIIQTSTNSLTVSFSSPQEGYVTVINVGDFTFTPPSGIPSTSQSGIFMGNSTSWNINHGFNTNFLIVDTWDDSGTLSEKNIANSTIVNDSNNITVDWDGTVVDGHISIIAVDDGTGQYKANQTSATQWNVNHGLNSNEIIVQCWDGSGNLIHPNYIEKTDNNNLVVDFDGVNTNGNICIISTDMTITDGDTYFNSLSAAGTWSITHSLASQNLIVQVWSGDRVVSEYTTTINDDNTITIDFDGSSVAGDVMIIKVS